MYIRAKQKNSKEKWCALVKMHAPGGMVNNAEIIMFRAG